MKRLMRGILTGIIGVSTVIGFMFVTAKVSEAVEAPMYEGSAVLTKELQIPFGTPVPDTTFEFTVDAKGIEDGAGGLDSSKAGECPTWVIDNLSFGNSDTISAANTIEKSTDIWTKINDLTFLHAGVYYYEISEKPTSASTIIDSQAIYTVKVYVENTSSGPKVTGITVNQEQNDSGIATGKKVDPTPDPTHSEFRFINKYWDVTNVQVEKLVAADGTGDYGDRTKDFDFTLTLNLPSTTDETFTKVNYIKTDKSGGTTTGDVTITNHPNPTGTLSITLKHGETIDFTNLPVGSTYTVAEKRSDGYTPSAEVTGVGTHGTGTDGTAGTDLYTVKVDGKMDLFVLAETAEIKNTTVVTNTFKSPNITGIIMENLPFILMVVVAGAGIVFIVLTKRRRA